MPQVKFDIFSIISGIAICIFFIYIALILKNWKNRKTKIILCLYIAANSVIIFNFGFLLIANLYYYLPQFINTHIVAMFILGPLFYIYVRTLIKNESRYIKYKFLHFLPALVYMTMIIWNCLYGTIEYRIDFTKRLLDGSLEKQEIFLMCAIQSILAVQYYSYVMATIRIVKRHQRRIKDNYSSFENKNLHFLRLIIALLLIYLSASVIAIIVAYFFKDVRLYFRIITLCFAFLSCLFLYKIYTNPVLMLVPDKRDLPKDAADKEKYARNILPEKLMEDYYSGMLDIMKREKLYKNPHLSILNLAEKLNISRFSVSLILNKYAHVSFYNFINDFRVEEALNLMSRSDNRKMSVLEIAFESGFNSKSTFNNLFKRKTKLTPSEFMKQCRAAGNKTLNNMLAS